MSAAHKEIKEARTGEQVKERNAWAAEKYFIGRLINRRIRRKNSAAMMPLDENKKKTSMCPAAVFGGGYFSFFSARDVNRQEIFYTRLTSAANDSLRYWKRAIKTKKYARFHEENLRAACPLQSL